jgi:hypothetical protein
MKFGRFFFSFLAILKRNSLHKPLVNPIWNLLLCHDSVNGPDQGITFLICCFCFQGRELMEHFVELPPELCTMKIIGFSKDMCSSLSLLPSLMCRLENLLVAIELKEAMLSSFSEASQISASGVSYAIFIEFAYPCRK